MRARYRERRETLSSFGVPFYFGWAPGAPPGVPGGLITGVRPPPGGGVVMFGSTAGGGQMTPFDCAR